MQTDVATATARHDHMDFLIDIIPRTGVVPQQQNKQQMGGGGGGKGMGGGGGGGHAQMVQVRNIVSMFYEIKQIVVRM